MKSACEQLYEHQFVSLEIQAILCEKLDATSESQNCFDE